MRKGFEAGLCEFCNLDRTFNKVVWEDEMVLAWTVPKQYLRKELQAHYIIIPKRHVRFPWELKTHEVLMMQDARIYLATMFDLPGGIVATRFGDMRLNAGTVPHLHENIMVPNGAGEIRIPAVKDPADRRANQERATEFSKRYEAGEQP